MNHPFAIQPRQINDTKITINNIFKEADIYLYPYARYAFLEVLKVLEIQSVYLPAFICRDMLAPINVLNIQYHFYEVDEKMQPILQDIKCDAILMVNYFGFPMEMEQFLEYKNRYGAFIIEDNAHGFLSRDSSQRLLGTRGDIGLLSIRKTLFLPNGGALLINNPLLKEKKYKSAEIKTSDEDQKYFKKLNLKKKFFSKYIGICVLLIRRLIRYFRTGSSIPLPDPLSEKEMPTNKYLTPLLKNGSIHIDIEKEVQRRIEMYGIVEEIAKKYDIEALQQLNDFVVPFEFAFIDDGKTAQFEKDLLAKGFFLLPWPDLPDEIVHDCPDFYKNVKVVPFLW